MIQPKAVVKEEEAESQVSACKEVIKIAVKINEIKTNVLRQDKE